MISITRKDELADLLQQDDVKVAAPEDPCERLEPLSLVHGERPLQSPHVDVQDPQLAFFWA